jgi:uncharacterized membrane protein YtjA (UPF0391 family)
MTHYRGRMLWTLIGVPLVLWALGLAFKVAAGAIHILLVVAIVLFLVNVIAAAVRRCSCWKLS